MMFGTPWIAILSVLAAAVLGATGQFLFKAGTNRAGDTPFGWLATPCVWAGLACYLAVMALTTFAFRKGGGVSVLYPVYATTFVWAAVIAAVGLGRPILPVHLLGMLLLIAGVCCMSVGHVR